MTRFSDLPIQRKLLGSVLLAVTVAALMLGGSIALYEAQTYRPRFVEGAREDARMLADLLVPALEFDDPRTADAQLASLDRRADMAAAAIYLTSGRRFAAHSQPSEKGWPDTWPGLETLASIDGRRVTVVEPIRNTAGGLGWVVLRLELPTLGDRLAEHGVFALASVASLATLALLLSYVLKRAVSLPAEGLMRAAQEVAEKKNYALRAPVRGRDEFGRLAGAFNEMLATIGVRDAELIREGEHLRAAQAALVASERRHREMVEAAPDAIFTVDAGGRIREPNTALGRLTLRPAADWAGARLGDELHAADRDEATRALGEAARAGLAGAVVLRLKRADGTFVPLECHFARRGGEGGAGGVLCVGRDQTERHAAQAERERLEDQLRQAQRLEAVGTLAGGIAHDFNNILTALLGNLELVEGELSAVHPARAYLRNSRQAGQRARDLVRQILTFSRRQEARRRPLRMAAIAEEALGLLRASLPATIEITSRFEADAPLVLADETQVHQVIMNLATNAFHAMEQRGGRLSVEVAAGEVGEAERARHPQLRAGRFVVLTVADTGCGMDETTQLRLFEPFFTTKPPGRGTGLGMAVVHGILQSHDASIAVESVLERGTVVRVYFPTWREGGDASTVSPPVAAVVAAEAGPPARVRVLLVDDEPAVAQIAEMLLRRQGYEVSTFLDPRQAAVAFEKQPAAHDLLITDLTMPHLSGLDLAARLRERRSDLPVVVMTGYDGFRSSAAFAAARLTGPLQKPFGLEEFLRAISEALATNRQSRAAE